MVNKCQFKNQSKLRKSKIFKDQQLEQDLVNFIYIDHSEEKKCSDIQKLFKNKKLNKNKLRKIYYSKKE